ncbi:MAG: hypothetical protein AAF411_08600 [Myxococcota bacterium]
MGRAMRATVYLLSAAWLGCSDGVSTSTPTLYVGEELNCAIVRAAAEPADAGRDAEDTVDMGADAGIDARLDASDVDAGVDAGAEDGGEDAGAGVDAGAEDAGTDAGTDAGSSAVPMRNQVGQLRCWGQGQAQPAPLDLPGALQAADLVLGGSTHCLVDGSGAYQCWGDASRGQLAQAVQNPAGLTQLTVPVDDLQIARYGGAFLCGRAGNELLCWGAGEQGELGRQRLGDSAFPEPVALPDGELRAFALGARHGCAVVGSEVRCWGDGSGGQLGEGSALVEPDPRAVTLPDDLAAALVDPAVAVALDAGEAFTCLQVGQSAWCWGDDTFGQLAQRAPVGTLGAVVAVPLENIAAVSLGREHACASDGSTVFCWGRADNERLGSNTINPIGPVRALASGIPQIGGQHGCVQNGVQIRCWGAAEGGLLGPLQTIDTAVPTQIPGLR